MPEHPRNCQRTSFANRRYAALPLTLGLGSLDLDLWTWVLGLGSWVLGLGSWVFGLGSLDSGTCHGTKIGANNSKT
jgi:hypothetical protein